MHAASLQKTNFKVDLTLSTNIEVTSLSEMNMKDNVTL